MTKSIPAQGTERKKGGETGEEEGGRAHGGEAVILDTLLHLSPRMEESSQSTLPWRDPENSPTKEPSYSDDNS